MSSKNQKPETTIRTNEGAPAKRINSEQELTRSVMACLLWENSFYENGVSIEDRISALVKKCKPEFVSELAIKARSEMNLRHAPMLLAREMARNYHGKIVADTIYNVVQRADELSEFLAIYWDGKRSPISSQVKKGLARAFTKFNEYQLAKYNRDNAVRLRDVLFMVHAKPKDKIQEETWKKLVDGKLPIPDTWETELSSGKNKGDTFIRLMAEKKLGALATIRNIRNMEEAGVDRKTVANYLYESDLSRVLPFRFVAAATMVPAYEAILEKAMFKAISGYDKMKGKTVILVDVSGSMDDNLSGKSDMKRWDAAAALAMIAREICDEVVVMTFSNTIVEVAPRRGFALRDAIINSQGHGGTYLGRAVEAVNKNIKYDRLIVITDEQSHDAVPGPTYKGYMINVASNKNGVGYGKWIHFDGFSESIIRYIQEAEKVLDKQDNV